MTTSTELSPKERRIATIMFSFGVLMYIVINIHRVAVPGQIFDALQQELSLSASAVAALGTSFLYVYAGCQLIVGLLVDKYGGMRVMTAGSILMTIGAILFPLANSYWLMLVSRILVGLGCSATYLSMVKETDRLFPQKFAFVMGILVLFGYSGGAIGTAPLAMASKVWGWRTCMFSLGILGAIALAGILLLWKFARLPEQTKIPMNLKMHIAGFTNVNNLILVFSFTISYGIFYAYLSVMGKKFLEDCGVSHNLAALTCTSMIFLPAIVNNIVGILTTAMGNRRRPFYLVMNIFPVIGCAIMAICLLFQDFPGRGYLLITALVCLCMIASFTPITSSLTRETNPPEATGTALGIVNFSAYIMTAICGTIAGAVLDLFGGTPTADGTLIYPQKAYLTLAIVFFLLTLSNFRLALKVPETNGQRIYNGKTFRFLGLHLHT